MTNPFASRYALARYSTGGVVLDLSSGNYFRVNQTAALVCAALLDESDPTARIAREFGTDESSARTLVADVAAGLDAPPLSGTPQGSYHFAPRDRGYVLTHGQRTVLIVSEDLSIRRSEIALSASLEQLELYVRALAPKLLFQLGIAVIHASAVRIGNAVVAFAGLSGAGKTTTAHAFCKAGANLVSEDLLVIEQAGLGTIKLDGEAVVRRWAKETAQDLHTSASVRSSDSLMSSMTGPSAALNQLILLAHNRRSGNEFTFSKLDGPATLIEVMDHIFLGAKEPSQWRRYFQLAREFADAIQPLLGTAPEGIEQLLSAARRYIEKTAS